MTDREKGDSGKKKLGLSAGTLKLNQPSSGKLKLGANKPVSGGRPSSGTVVVVTKKGGSKASGSEGLTREEKARRLEAIKQAESSKKVQMQQQNELAAEQAEHAEAQRLLDEEKAVLEKAKTKELAEQKENKKQEVKRNLIRPAVNNDEILREIASGKTKVKNLNTKVKKTIVIDPKKEEEKTDKKPEEAAKGPVIYSKEDKPVASNKFANKKSGTGGETEVENRELTVKRKKKVAEKVSKKISVSQVMMLGEGDDLESMGRNGRKNRHKKVAKLENKEKIKKEIEIRGDEISVQELASKMSEKATDVIKVLMKMGVMATINQSIDTDTAELVTTELGHICVRASDENDELVLLEAFEDKAEDLLPRPPIVTIMGHVDHGKTSLLDSLRATDVVAGEAGGITQHIGAYQVELSNNKHITFLDTPGHEAFTAMRLRGAHVTDIVILVVAADDGIMEQTIEAISHAKAAEVPIIVAINKIDKPDADVTRVKNELLQHNLVPEDFGGEVMCVEVSAKQKMNLDKLEEIILLQAEMLELKANPSRQASGSVVESRMDKGRGAVATLLVQNGTLKKGEIVVAGNTYGRVKALINDKGKVVREAIPAMPVEILGLGEVPVAGDVFDVVKDEKTARDVIEIRKEKSKKSTKTSAVSLDQLFKQAGSDRAKELSVVIKADVQGSVEAIIGSLEKLSNDEINVKVLHSGVGGILASDITLALASEAIIIGFNVRADSQAKNLAIQTGVDVRYYSIIYQAVDEIKSAMSGMLAPTIKEEYIGTAEVKEVINITKVGKVAGCLVIDGLIKRNAHARLIRDNVVIYEGTLKTLRRFKDDVKEVKNGFECGISFEKYDDLKPQDKIEVFDLIEEQRQL